MFSLLFSYYFLLFFQTTANGDCMFSAVLQQMHCLPEYKAIEFRRQVAWYLSKHANLFCSLAPLKDGKTFESYIREQYSGYIWGDDCCLAAISHMWNVAITVISAEDPEPRKIFHNKKHPDIVLVTNKTSGDEIHYSAAGKIS